MNDQELSDTELFDQAVTGDGAEDISDQQSAQQVDQTQQQADVATSQDQPTDADRQQIDDNAPHIPSWRLREVNEERRRFAEENERIKAELAELRRASQQQRREQPAEEKDGGPDPLLDPKGYAKSVRDEVRQELIAERREESLQRAAKTYKDEFTSAYKAAQQNVDPALRARMQESRDPGETLIEWHREQMARAEIGNDLAAYKQRLREEALKDPEFRKAAMEAWRNEGQRPSGQNNGRPKVELPPSMTGASRANAALRSQDTGDDVSDRELFEQIAG